MFSDTRYCGLFRIPSWIGLDSNLRGFGEVSTSTLTAESSNHLIMRFGRDSEMISGEVGERIRMVLCGGCREDPVSRRCVRMGKAHVSLISSKVAPPSVLSQICASANSGESSKANGGKEPSEYFTRLDRSSNTCVSTLNPIA